MNKNELHTYVEKNCGNIRSIIGLKNGKVLYEDYWEDFKAEDTLNVMSVTKSVTSLLIGIAIDKGLIKDVHQKVLEFFPEYTIKRNEKTIQNVTIEHLLTMTAPYKYKSEPWSKVCSSNDWTKAALDILGGRAGIIGAFKYSTLGIHILTGIIAKSSGMSVIDFANRYLFEPLGISPRKGIELKTAEEHKDFVMSKNPKKGMWVFDAQGVCTAGWGLCLSAQEMAKIGQLCINNGKYNGKQIVSSEWITKSTKPYYKCNEQFGNMFYGYLWWIIDEKSSAYAAIGDGGNIIYVNPDKDIVVSVISTFKPCIFDRVQFIQQYIEPLLK